MTHPPAVLKWGSYGQGVDVSVAGVDVSVAGVDVSVAGELVDPPGSVTKMPNNGTMNGIIDITASHINALTLGGHT